MGALDELIQGSKGKTKTSALDALISSNSGIDLPPEVTSKPQPKSNNFLDTTKKVVGKINKTAQDLTGISNFNRTGSFSDFENQSTATGDGAFGFNPGSGHGSPFDFHIVTPKYSVKEGSPGVGKSAFNLVSQLAEGTVNNTNDLFDFSTAFIPKLFQAKQKKQDVLEGAVDIAKVATSGLGLKFAQVSAELGAASESGIPVISQLAGGANKIFEYAGLSGDYLTGKAVDALPVSDETKGVIRQPLEELGSIAAQTILAHGVGMASEKSSDFSMKNEMKSTLSKNADGSYQTSLTSEPSGLQKAAGMGGEALRFALNPLSEAAKTLSKKLSDGISDMRKNGKDPNDPNVAKEVVNQAVKETPADIPGVMKVIKVDVEGKPIREEPMKVYTDQKLVLQNMIQDAERITYKVDPERSVDLNGSPVSGKFVWDYGNQKATVYVADAKTASDLAREFGHKIGDSVAEEVNKKLGSVIPAYEVNGSEARSAVASMAVRSLGGNATESQIDNKVLTLASKIASEASKLGENPVQSAIADPNHARSVAPNFYEFVKSESKPGGMFEPHANETKMVMKEARSNKKADENGQKVASKDSRGTFVEETKKTPPGSKKEGKNGALEVKPGQEKQTPVKSEGETRFSGLAKGVEENAIARKLTNGFEGLPEYNKVSMKDQAKQASDLLKNDPDSAVDIALGKKTAPEGLLPESVFVAVEAQAIKTGDIETLRRLATESTLSSEATAMGQRIRALGERDGIDVISTIRNVTKNRAEAAKENLNGKTVDQATGEITKEIKAEVEKSAPKKQDWQGFIESIKC